MTLLPQHQELLERSGIDPAVAEQRGYSSVKSKLDLKRLGFRDYQQRVPALLIPVYNVLGEIATYQIRPDSPRITTDGQKARPVKYEMIGGSTMTIDCLPRLRAHLGDPGISLIITEGIRKADAAISRGWPTLALLGVWNWRHTNSDGGKTSLPDLEVIAWNGRRVLIAFDSDAMEKVSVYRALGRFGALLESRGAEVFYVYLPRSATGEKQGLDDWIAAGGDLAQLGEIATPNLRRPTLLEEPTLEEQLEDAAPSTAGLHVPTPYTLTPSAVWATRILEDGTEEPVQIASAPLVISGILRDADEGRELLRLEWRREGKWAHSFVDRGKALDARKLVELAGVGAPVTSITARPLVAYLESFEARNLDAIPHARLTRRLGWQGDDGFLWGSTLVRAGERVEIKATDPREWTKDHLIFVAEGSGEDQLRHGYRQEGSLEGWRAAAALVAGYTRPLITMYSAFVPPLLDVLRAPNFIVDLSNRTSTGKTTTLRLAASVWGNPDEKSADSVLGTWDLTQVFLERSSAFASGLPLILDDTKRARRPGDIAKMLYTVASGKGRGRGTVGGVARSTSWRTVLISNGEAPITSFSQDDGARMRVVSLRGQPFGEKSRETERLVHQINRGVCSNFGHAGPTFVAWLQAQRDRWDSFREEYRDAVEKTLADAGDEEQDAGRLAEYACAIEMAAVLAHEALQLPWECEGLVERIWKDLVSDALDAAGDRRALEMILAWASSREYAFDGRAADVPPGAGWLGCWTSHILAINPLSVKEQLTREGFDPRAILDAWRERGWIECDAGRHTVKRYRVGGGTPRLVAIRPDALKEVGWE